MSQSSERQPEARIRHRAVRPTADVSDRALVRKAAEGDVASFEVLVRRHQLEVFRLCLNMVGNRADAADVSQEVFFTAWRAVGRFHGDSSFKTWLYRIATNHSLKFLRRRAVPRDAVEDQASPWGRPEGELEAAETMKAVSRAVASLTPEQRAPLLLREVEGLNYSEIAQVLGLSVSAVKSRINRARVELAAAMEGAS